MKSILHILLALITVVATAALAGQSRLSMPPSFTDEVQPETVLRAYRLGVMFAAMSLARTRASA